MAGLCRTNCAEDLSVSMWCGYDYGMMSGAACPGGSVGWCVVLCGRWCTGLGWWPDGWCCVCVLVRRRRRRVRWCDVGVLRGCGVRGTSARM